MDISVRDLRMMYQSSLVLWKGEPVYISEIDDYSKVKMYDLGTQKYKTVKWIPENFIPPSVRIGYINLGTNCVYAHRIPARRYKIGLSQDNVIKIKQDHALSPAEEEEADNILSRFKSSSLYNSLTGRYPSLEEAFEEAKENRGFVAFDKQFAVGHDRRVFYKGKAVGIYDEDGIKFLGKYSYLTKALISR
jgi:hypothetical protein